MAAQEEQPDWLNLPSDLLMIIARRSRHAVTGLTAFRSVCRTWRAASGPAPRLLLPRPRAARLVFPLSRGWSIVFHVRDASCHVSHLATGATAALPALSAFRDAVKHARYVECGTAAYCYSVQDNKLECVYKSSPKDDGPPGCSTKPSWFIP